MRLIAIIPLVASLVAFIMTMILLLAGTNPGTLEEVNILTFNISRLGQNLLQPLALDTNPQRNCSALPLLDQPGCALDNLGSSASSALNNASAALVDALNDGIGNLSRSAGLHDFYSVHVLGYCEGFYVDDDNRNDKDVTGCSPREALFSFEPRSVLQAELNPPLNLVADFDWPEDIDRAAADLRTASRAMFVLYCLAAAFAGLGVLVGAAALVDGRRALAVGNAVLVGLAALALVLASAVATAVAVQGARKLSEDGEDIGVSAYRGDVFLGVTWAAAALVLVGAAAEGAMGCCLHPDRKRRRGRGRGGGRKMFRKASYEDNNVGIERGQRNYEKNGVRVEQGQHVVEN